MEYTLNSEEIDALKAVIRHNLKSPNLGAYRLCFARYLKDVRFLSSLNNDVADFSELTIPLFYLKRLPRSVGGSAGVTSGLGASAFMGFTLAASLSACGVKIFEAVPTA